MPSNFSPLSLLTRPDKWYLGGGNRLLYAPAFPLHRSTPGLWDTAHYYNYPLQPLFSYAILADDGHEIPLTHASSSWRPDGWTRRFVAADKTIELSEVSVLLPLDVVVSRLTIRNRTSRGLRLRVVGFTAREHRPGGTTWVTDATMDRAAAIWMQHVHPEKRPALAIGCAFGCDGSGVRIEGGLSEGVATLPLWSHTPFSESVRSRRKPRGISMEGVTAEGHLWISAERSITLRPKTRAVVHFGFAASSSADEARQALQTAMSRKDPIGLSTAAWKDHFASVPQFRSSDPFLTAAYWYRWYGLRLNTIYGGEGNYEHPAVCEGIGYFRAPISYSAPCHMLENRWMHDPDLARGSLRTFIANQRDDGGFRGYIDVNHYRQEMHGASVVEPFYHADWGRAVLALDAVHPSDEFLTEAYDGLKKYASYFDKERDEEVSGLYDIDNHYETGQEYMHRYTAVDPNADRDNWGEVFRLKGVDVTVYLYELKRALAAMARRLGKDDEAGLWDMESDRTREAVRTIMWDPVQEMFFDVDPKTGRRTGVKAATCFYPYLTDIVTRGHLTGLKRHLLSPKEFWTPWPVPSTSVDDPTFSAEPVWKGKRMNCPWNGRVWPMTNSHIMEALAASAGRFNDRRLEKAASEFLSKFIRMLFFDQDPTRPNCFEHYHPFTGQPSAYRGVDDYMHSWVNDLIIHHVMGIRAEPGVVRVRPLSMGLAEARISGVIIQGSSFDVSLRDRQFTVWQDRQIVGTQRLGKTIEIQLERSQIF
ncbi:MAG: hypothetical protein MUE68_04880 [Bacteroidetes bacterium]|jgi:hypothetical protein|nr:hypothetical protein [Bacteroidota bacterium]